MRVYYNKRNAFQSIEKLISYSIHKKNEIEYSSIRTFKDIKNVPNSLYAVSIVSYRQINELYESIEKFKENNEINFKIVIGGPGLSMINLDDLREYIPEISFIIEGKGERYFNRIISGDLEEGIYIEADCNIEPYPISKEFKKSFDVFPFLYNTSFNYTNCSWNKCKFCYHTEKVKSREYGETIDDILLNYDIGIRNFFITDNYLVMTRFYRLLDELIKLGIDDVSFSIFGSHVNSNYKELEKYLPKFKKLILNIAPGFEFLDDKILRLYNKGTTVKEIVEYTNFMSSNEIDLHPYFLYGLPLATERNLWVHLSNYGLIRDKIAASNVSFFMLIDGIDIYNHPKDFNIKINRNLTLNDYDKELPPIRTSFYDFEAYDNIRKRFLTRDEEYIKNLRYIKNIASPPIPQDFFLGDLI